MRFVRTSDLLTNIVSEKSGVPTGHYSTLHHFFSTDEIFLTEY